MLPKTKLGRAMLKKLKVYGDSRHPTLHRLVKEHKMAKSFYATGKRKTVSLKFG